MTPDLALDAVRGFTIALMILVNTPGTWSDVYSLLLHADWHGATATNWCMGQIHCLSMCCHF